MVACPAFVLWIALGPFAAASPQEDPAAARAQAQRILDHGDYQQAAPSTLTGATPAPTAPKDAKDHADPTEGFFHRSNLSGVLGHAPLLVPIVVGALLLLLLLLGVTRQGGLAELRRRSQAVAASAVVGATAPSEAEGDPDALAAEGRFAEAIHLLLLRALRGLARSLGGLARGLTSREILPRAPDGAPRTALQELVAAVELHEFGAHDLTARDFERCRAAAAALQSAPEVARPKGRR